MTRAGVKRAGVMSASVRMGVFTGAFFAGAGITQAFLPLWLSDRGISAGQIGALLGLSSVIRLAAVPGWGALADRVPHRRALLACAALSTALLAACYPLAHSTLVLGLLITLQGINASALTPLTDTMTMALVMEGRLRYGRVRAWGSAAYMLATAAAGPVLTATGSGLVPWLVAGSYGLAGVLTRLLPAPTRTVHLAEPGSVGLLRLPAFRAAVLASALIQGSHAAYYAFAPILWRAAGLNDTAIGLLVAEGIVMEIVLFVWGGAWAARLGPARLTACAATACLLRWSVIAVTADVAVLIVVQALHAATFAMQHLSSMTVLARTVPPRRAAGAQALHGALGISAPTGLLIWLTGLAYAQIGGMVFVVMAALGGCGLLLVRPLARTLPNHAVEVAGRCN